LHTCLQGKYNIGSIFVDKTGYNQVADANDIIVIYPQAKATSGSNANGCWDW
jgi:poly(3-hydroxybutyrate) depolymerase